MTDQPQDEQRRLRLLNERQPAYDAVYAYIRKLSGELPPDAAHRNAMIWRAVNAALDAQTSTAEAAIARGRQLAARIRQGAPWTANDDDIANRIEAALDVHPETLEQSA